MCRAVVENQFLTLMSVFKGLLNKLADPSSLRYSPGTSTSSTPVSPVYASSSASASTLENLSRTIRGYVHSSIPIPTSPPSNSCAIGGTASGSPSRQDRVSQQEFERDYELDNEEDNDYYDNSSKRNHHTILHHETNSGNVKVPSPDRQLTVMMGSSGLAQAMQRNLDADSKSPSDQVEAITWARWDVLHERYAFPLLNLLRL